MTKPDPAAVYLHPDQLRPWDRNPRKNDEAVEGVVRSIEAFGFGAPILVRRENMTIIAGHTRWKAAQQLGLDKVPVRIMDLTEGEAWALAIADNKTGERAEWDNDGLTVLLEGLENDGIDLAVLGFGDGIDAFPSQEKSGSSGGSHVGTVANWEVVMDCADEREQQAAYNDAVARGFRVRLLTI